MSDETTNRDPVTEPLTTDATWDSLQLRDTIWESYPWDDGRVFERHIGHVTVHTEKRSDYGAVKTWRRLYTDEGGILGSGVEIEQKEWLTKYFPTREQARRDCVTRRAEFRREHLAQLEAEQVRLSAELENVKAQLAPKATQ